MDPVIALEVILKSPFEKGGFRQDCPAEILHERWQIKNEKCDRRILSRAGAGIRR